MASATPADAEAEAEADKRRSLLGSRPVFGGIGGYGSDAAPHGGGPAGLAGRPRPRGVRGRMGQACTPRISRPEANLSSAPVRAMATYRYQTITPANTMPDSTVVSTYTRP